ncbi:MAG: hypothetical protein ABIL46_07145 [candidate division WOR-3 bacterium]
MDNAIIKKIKKEVAKQFPEFKGIEPDVVKKKILPQKTLYKKLSLGVAEVTKTVISFRFVKKVKMADNIAMKRILIVTTDEQGRIIKISQSK